MKIRAFLLEQKLRLKSEFEKELPELRRKYNVKFQEALETNLKTVCVSRILSHAFRSKCLDLKAGASGVQHGTFVFHRHLSFNIAFTALTQKLNFTSIPFQLWSVLVVYLFFLANLLFFIDWSSFNLNNKPELADTFKFLRVLARKVCFSYYLSFLRRQFLN